MSAHYFGGIGPYLQIPAKTWENLTAYDDIVPRPPRHDNHPGLREYNKHSVKYCGVWGSESKAPRGGAALDTVVIRHDPRDAWKYKPCGCESLLGESTSNMHRVPRYCWNLLPHLQIVQDILRKHVTDKRIRQQGRKRILAALGKA